MCQIEALHAAWSVSAKNREGSLRFISGLLAFYFTEYKEDG